LVGIWLCPGGCSSWYFELAEAFFLLPDSGGEGLDNGVELSDSGREFGEGIRVDSSSVVVADHVDGLRVTVESRAGDAAALGDGGRTLNGGA